MKKKVLFKNLKIHPNCIYHLFKILSYIMLWLNYQKKFTDLELYQMFRCPEHKTKNLIVILYVRLKLIFSSVVFFCKKLCLKLAKKIFPIVQVFTPKTVFNTWL